MFCLLTGKDILPFPFSIAPLLVLWLPLFTRLLFFVALHYPRFVYSGSYPRSHPQTLLSWGVWPILFLFHDLSSYLPFFFLMHVCSSTIFISSVYYYVYQFSVAVISSYILHVFSPIFSYTSSNQSTRVESVRFALL